MPELFGIVACNREIKLNVEVAASEYKVLSVGVFNVYVIYGCVFKQFYARFGFGFGAKRAFFYFNLF